MIKISGMVQTTRFVVDHALMAFEWGMSHCLRAEMLPDWLRTPMEGVGDRNEAVYIGVNGDAL